MRVMVLIKGTKSTETGIMPDAKLLQDMGRFNEELMKGGVLLAGDGLKPTRFARRIRITASSRDVSEGPFGNPDDLVAGYWVWQVASMDEAVAWAKRCPMPMPEDSTIELRPLYESEDFAGIGDEMASRMGSKTDALAAQGTGATSHAAPSGSPQQAGNRAFAPVVWFEIYTSNLERSQRFYETVLGYTLQDAPLPEGADATQMAMKFFPMQMGLPGATGALVRMDGVPIGAGGTMVYFHCEDCAVEAARIEQAGGKVMRPKSSLGQYGFMALGTDPDGNTFGLHSMR